MTLRPVVFVLSMLASAVLAADDLHANIFERGDAGASVLDHTGAAPAPQFPVSGQPQVAAGPMITVKGEILAQGGGVRGMGVLAEYPAAGSRRMLVTRTTQVRPKEPYLPVALMKVIDPAGKTVKVVDMTGQTAITEVYEIEIPDGAAGVWIFSVSGGRQFDQLQLQFSAAESWGVRGEMILSLNETIPNPAYLYLPETVKQIAIERFGGDEQSVTVSTASGTLLGAPKKCPQSGKRNVLQLEQPQAGGVLKLNFAGTGGRAVVIDGAPGLLCASEEVARKLKGGVVSASGMITAGPLQARAREWMVTASRESLDVPVKTAEWTPETIEKPEAQAQLCAAVVHVQEAVAKQEVNPASTFFGSGVTEKPAGPEWDSFHYRLFSPWYTAQLALPAAVESPINPYYKDPALVRRATLSALLPIAALQGDSLVREAFLGADNAAGYPITHAFFVYSALAENYRVIKDLLDPAAKEIWREGIINIGDKLADYQGYQSNQWAHNLTGHLNTYLATGEKRFLNYFESQLVAYLDGTWGADAKFGQHPAGFYLEEFGADGNYGNMNQSAIAGFYYTYRKMEGRNPVIEEKLRRSIEKNLAFRSLFWLRKGNGELMCPTAFNSRRSESSLLWSNPSGEYLASREFDLAYTHTVLVPMPAKGVFPASVFSYYANTPAWGLRMLQEMRAGGRMNGSSLPHKEVYETYSQTAQRVTLPVEETKKFWTLPGIIAAKQNGLYAVCFYDVAGTAPGRKLLGFMEGGPTALSCDGLGVLVSSMAPSTVNNKIETEEHLTFSCVYGTGENGALVYSGKARAEGRVTEDGAAWEIASEFNGGKLNWSYRYAGDALEISVVMSGGKPGNFWINLPFFVDEQRVFKEAPQELRISDGAGKEHVRAAFPAGTVFTKPLVYHKNQQSVRCLRIPLASDGRPVKIMMQRVLR